MSKINKNIKNIMSTSLCYIVMTEFPQRHREALSKKDT